MKPDTKTVGKRRRAAPRKKIADLRAELDDFIRRVPTLSQPELDQAKEKLIQKLAYSTNRVTRPSIDDIRKKIDPKIIYYGINILLAGVLLTKLSRARSVSADYGAGYRAGYKPSWCSHLTREGACKHYLHCAWCPEGVDRNGDSKPAHCYNPSRPKECKDCSSCCSSLTRDGEGICKDHPPCAWCPAGVDGHGDPLSAHCYNPLNVSECNDCSSC
ncbi:hypothetical protein SAMN05216386_2408 [Nitrosospira briensis]|uniref:Uncharacterized protein n=1 Tax=Nitrosospira briensis TaxID=35799 RepID=A0A1I5DUG0_9PROT|nr:hypothetical protein SAMN05216386_2408 [Nitrosospira briensis]